MASGGVNLNDNPVNPTTVLLTKNLLKPVQRPKGKVLWLSVCVIGWLKRGCFRTAKNKKVAHA